MKKVIITLFLLSSCTPALLAMENDLAQLETTAAHFIETSSDDEIIEALYKAVKKARKAHEHFGHDDRAELYLAHLYQPTNLENALLAWAQTADAQRIISQRIAQLNNEKKDSVNTYLSLLKWYIEQIKETAKEKNYRITMLSEDTYPKKPFALDKRIIPTIEKLMELCPVVPEIAPAQITTAPTIAPINPPARSSILSRVIGFCAVSAVCYGLYRLVIKSGAKEAKEENAPVTPEEA